MTKPGDAQKRRPEVMELQRPKKLEFPITVNAIEFDQDDPIKAPLTKKIGSWVRVRPCAEEYENKTFLGILVGDVPLSLGASFNHETGTLTIKRSFYNPAILIPSLGKIVYGAESWWGMIWRPEDLEQITEEAIDSVWYVQALKQIEETKARRADNTPGADA